MNDRQDMNRNISVPQWIEESDTPIEKNSGDAEEIRYKISVFLLATNGEHQNITKNVIWEKA